MNGTPRMRSSYPSTPSSAQQSPDATQDGFKVRSPLPNLPDSPAAAPSSSSPVIPVHLVDAPSQRMYTFAVYGLLLVWRLYDWWQLVEEDTTSIGLFLKWGLIDLMFLFGIPLLRIPWLEWSETTSLGACCVHVILNGFLMFRIPVSYSITNESTIALTLCSCLSKDGYCSLPRWCSTGKCQYPRIVFGRQAFCETRLSLWESRLLIFCQKGMGCVCHSHRILR
jgi:hypothetical protein